jgi:hypothetical protein
VSGTPVPEAAIEEHGYPSGAENDVGTRPQARRRTGIDAKAEPRAAEKSTDFQLLRRVSPALVLHAAQRGRGGRCRSA